MGIKPTILLITCIILITPAFAVWSPTNGWYTITHENTTALSTFTGCFYFRSTNVSDNGARTLLTMYGSSFWKTARPASSIYIQQSKLTYKINECSLIGDGASGIWGVPIQNATDYWACIIYNINSNTTDDPEFYLNGVLIDETESSTPDTICSSEIGPIYVGCDENGLNCFQGSMSNIAIWNASLSENEAKSMTLGRRKRLPLVIKSASLKHYWAFDNTPPNQVNTVTNITLIPIIDVTTQWGVAPLPHYDNVQVADDLLSINADPSDDGQIEEYNTTTFTMPANSYVLMINHTVACTSDPDMGLMYYAFRKNATWYNASRLCDTGVAFSSTKWFLPLWTQAEIDDLAIRLNAPDIISGGDILEVDYTGVTFYFSNVTFRDYARNNNFLIAGTGTITPNNLMGYT